MKKISVCLVLFFVSLSLLCSAGQMRAVFLPENIYEVYQEGNIEILVRLMERQGWNEVYIPVYNGRKAFWPSNAYHKHNGPIYSQNDHLRGIIQAFTSRNFRVNAWFEGGLQIRENDHPIYKNNPEWFMKTREGETSVLGTYYLSPGNENAMRMIREMISELASNYSFSAICLDNFSWGSYHLGFENPVIEKYYDTYHLSPGESIAYQSGRWEVFRRNLLNMRIKEIYRHIKAVNPYIHVNGLTSTPINHHQEMQPWYSWLQGGYIDSIIVKTVSSSSDHLREEIKQNIEYAGPFSHQLFFSFPITEDTKDISIILSTYKDTISSNLAVRLPGDIELQNIQTPWEKRIEHPYQTNRLNRIILTADNEEATFRGGEWSEEKSIDSLSDSFYKSASEPRSVFNYITAIDKAGLYDVYVHIPAFNQKSSEAEYHVHHSLGREILNVDQTRANGNWLKIGSWEFSRRDRAILLSVSNRNVPEGKYILVDAIRLEYVPIQPEVRAAWSSRYQWTARTVAESKNNIRKQMEILRENNFNAIAFQVRPCMENYFPNPHEPFCGEFWNHKSPGIDPETGKEFDALEYAITQARLNGLKFYCYINTHTITVRPLIEEVSPQHRYHVHAHGDPEEDWRLYRAENEPLDQYSSYIWLCPGVPGGEAWTRKMVRYIVENYEIDGVHFDRIRTPSDQFTHNPISRRRFADPDANPDQFEDIRDFMRKQITDQLERIMGDINLIDPTMEVSTAPFGIVYTEPGFYQGTGTQSHYSWFQASYEWLKRGVVDEIFPQIYWDIGSAHPFEVLYAQWLHHSHGRHIHAGINNRWDEVRQIEEVRRQNGHGTILWHSNNSDYPRIKSELYQEPAPVPALPWKTHPTTGMITGTVIDQHGTPIQDAVIRISGDDYNFVTGADGRFSIVNKRPRSYHVTARKNHYTQQRKVIDIKAGEVKNLTIQLETK